MIWVKERVESIIAEPLGTLPVATGSPQCMAMYQRLPQASTAVANTDGIAEILQRSGLTATPVP
jgi:hypothetical protein